MENFNGPRGLMSDGTKRMPREEVAMFFGKRERERGEEVSGK